MSSKVYRARYLNIVNQISKETGFVNRDIDKVLHAFGLCVADRLVEENDKSIFLPNFGEFYIHTRKPGLQYDVNSNTKRYIVYDPKVKFRPTKKFLNRIFGSEPKESFNLDKPCRDEDFED